MSDKSHDIIMEFSGSEKKKKLCADRVIYIRRTGLGFLLLFTRYFVYAKVSCCVIGDVILAADF